ncbi:glycine cleavage system H protein [Carboxydocella thermautotrophica]|nr:glycine cleavage system H protein [Carboxydocella thermautotrophica]
MSKVLADLKYTKEHEWVKIEGNIATIGITDHAQEALGDVVFVDLPPVGTEISAGESFGTVESVKAVSDIYAPVTGKVIEVNQELIDAPEKINEDAYAAWMVKVEISEEPAELLTADEYEELLANE